MWISPEVTDLHYQAVYDEAVRLWRDKRDAGPAAEYVLGMVPVVSDREEQSRAYLLLGALQKRTQQYGEAEDSHKRALDQAMSTEVRLDAISSLIDIYVDLRRIEQGLRLVFEGEEHIKQLGGGTAKQGEAVFCHNAGRLLLLAGDVAAALPRLLRSAELFGQTGAPEERFMVMVALADAYLRQGLLDEADMLCDSILRSATSSLVLLQARLLGGKIAMKQGRVDQAERLVDQARRHATEQLGRTDMRVLLKLILAEADLDEARGELGSAERLRLLVQQWAGAARVIL